MLQADISIRVSKQLVAEGFSFPTSICFDTDSNAYIAESGLPWDGAEGGGKVFMILPGGKKQLLAQGLRHPLNGLCWHEGSLIVSEGGNPGRISRVTIDGKISIILDGLPGMGNYHTNMVAPGPDGKLYFSQGALTNMGVIGLDAYELGWLGRLPHNFDLPGYSITLKGQTFETINPLPGKNNGRAMTGAFSEFSKSHKPGTKLEPELPCTASVMRCDPDGSNLELVAWGVRNAYGLGFLPDGRLIATDQGSDDRGSRPIGNVPELMFEIKQGAWYGWPDFIGGIPVTDLRFAPSRGPKPDFILSNHHELPPPEKPLIALPVNSAATKFDILPVSHHHFPGQIIIALFGDEKPMTAPPGYKVGRNILRIDTADWSRHLLPDLQLNRPIDVKYNAADDSIWVVDFGEFEMTQTGIDAKRESGEVWKVKSSDLFTI